MLHIGTKWRCFIFAKANASSEKAVYEARLSAYEAALRAMKRSLFRLHVFCPDSGKKVGVSEVGNQSLLQFELFSVWNNSLYTENCSTADQIDIFSLQKLENIT